MGWVPIGIVGGVPISIVGGVPIVCGIEVIFFLELHLATFTEKIVHFHNHCVS